VAFEGKSAIPAMGDAKASTRALLVPGRMVNVVV
jgi:hypothetical protein